MYAYLDNFSGGGFSSDRHPESLTPGEWGSMNGIDFRATELTSPGTDVTALTGCPIQPTWSFFYRTSTGGFYIASDGVALYENSGTGWNQLASGWGGGLVTYTVFLGQLIINSFTDGPFYWILDGSNPAYDTWDNGDDSTWDAGPDTTWDTSPDASGIRPLPGWFEGATCLQIIAYKNFLVAIRLDDPARQAGTAPYLVAWSAEAATGTVPATWYTSPLNQAGNALLQDTQAALTGAGLLRDDLIIYKDDGIYRMSYTQNPTFPMLVERVHTCDGISYPGAIGVCSNLHYLVTRAGIEVFDGQTVQPIDYPRLQEEVKQRIAAASSEITVAAAYPAAKQIWIGYKLNQGEPYQGILKFDIQMNAFTIHDYSAEGMTSLCPGQIFEDTLTATDTWDGGPDTTWDGGADIPWNPEVTDPIQDTVFMAFAGGKIVRYTPYGGSYRNNGNPKTARAIKTGIRFADSTRRVIIRGLYPKVRGDGEFRVTLGKAWEQIPDQYLWTADRIFDPGTLRRLNYREIGGNFAIEIGSIDGSSWRFAGMGIEYEVLGDSG